MQNSWRIQHDRSHGTGAYTWYFPDGDRPPVDNGPAEAHESLMILNTSQHPANVELDLYWTDKEPILGIKVRVEAERVRCLRVPWFEDPNDAQRVEIPFRTQYAIRVRSDVPVICQYGRLEVIPNHMLYTTMGYVDPSEEERKQTL
jgi:hypothetical protein